MAVKAALAVEKIVQCGLTIAMQNGKPGNGPVIMRLAPIRADTFGLKRRLGAGMQ